MNKKVVYIEDQDASTIQTELMNRGLDIEVISPSGFDETLQDLNAKNFAAIIMDFRLTSGIGRVDAPTFASTFRTVGSNHKQVPMILISNEENLPFFSQDFTSQDLFDFVISKNVLRKNYDKYSERILSLIEAYELVDTYKFNLTKVLNIENVKNLDYRFIALLNSFKLNVDVYGYIRTINNSLIRAIGPLVGPDVLAARLGIDKTCEDFNKLLSTPEFTLCKYYGVLSQTYERWWFDKIQQLWSTITKDSMRRTTAEVRVNILNKRFDLNLRAALPLEMATNSTFWTICHENKRPLDPVDGFQYRNRHIDEWLEPEYISLISALEDPTQQEYLSPRDKEEVLFLGNQAYEK